MFSFCIMGTFCLNAQVTIGLDEEPEKAALLQIKDQPANADNITSTTGGFILPRVQLEKRKELIPFYEGASTQEKRLHTGLIVFNMKAVESEDLKAGIHYWDGGKWSPLVADEVGKAIFAIVSCDNVKIDGEGKAGVPLNSGNVMRLMVEVTKPGIYNIMARAEPHNGYYFHASGEFKVNGIYEILAMGAGTPINPKEDPDFDTVILELNGKKVNDCTKQFEIKDTSIRPRYDLSCGSVKVNGYYRVGRALNQDNTITLTINIENGSQGAPYHITTDEVGGISFEGEGILSGAGSHDITLYGTGTPNDLIAKTFTITTNSESSTVTCTAIVQPVIAQKSIIALGNERYGFTSGGSLGCKKMIDDVMNYGNNPNSIVKYEGFSNVTVDDDRLRDSKIKQYTGEDGSQPYDVTLITYNLRPESADQRLWLKNYVNKGGVLIYLDQGPENSNMQMIADIFEIPRPSYESVNENCNHVIKFAEDIDDEIINGPFGDVRGKQWGEDYANTIGLTSIPNGAIVYSGAINAYTGSQGGGTAADIKVTMMRHPTKNFFWCGDAGLINAASGGNTTGPFRVGPKTINGITYPGYPADKAAYGNMTSSGRMNVSNSTIFANVIAWALRMAEENGINTGK